MANEERVRLSLKMSTQEAEKGLENVQQRIKDVNKELKSNIDSFGFLGVTIGDVKKKFADLRQIGRKALEVLTVQGEQAYLGLQLMAGGKMRAGFGALFKTIKVGIAATGIGLLVVAFGSLVTFFTKTKRGAELLETALAGVGAAVQVITDRASKVGEALTKVFKGDLKGAIEDVKGAVSGIGEEIVKETKQMMDLSGASTNLRDRQRELNVETAERRAELEKLKLIAEDTTKTEQERLDAAQKGLDIETDLMDRRVAQAQEQLNIRKEELSTREKTAEDLDELAQLEIDLFNIQQESTTKQIELNNKVNAIRKEGEAKREAEEKERQAQIDEENKKREEKEKEDNDKKIEMLKGRLQAEQELELAKAESDEQRELLKLEQDEANALKDVEDLQTRLAIIEKFEIAETELKKKHNAERKADDEGVQRAKLGVMANAMGTISEIAGKESAGGKALAVGQATINTYLAATNALANTPAPPPFPQIAAAMTIINGFAQVKKIVATDNTPKFATGGMVRGIGTTTSDSVNARLSKGESVINAKSTRMFRPMLSAINQAGGGRGFANGGMIGGDSGGVTTGTVKAFVVADEMTTEQDRLNNIRRKATI
ncbi:MAG: hypothetical protein Unbinned1953contig1002_7 [Prokaryotic dsDNA virus sp.]|nr:MAG: hypothetical protein Unbinned1953contig1002_7 [Prokaryotic dsDNA virus sp.]|tara:strand:+ start:1542 stop:3350 length:1809 start_codon:yes stop_codon:yes gene_type:complete